MTKKTVVAKVRVAIALGAFCMAACAVPDRFSLPDEVTDKNLQVLVLWDTSGRQQAPESLRAFRPGDLFFDLPEPQRFFAVAESSTASLSQSPLRFERGPWLSMGEFDEQCELTDSGFDCNLDVPAEIEDETIFELCADDTRIQSLRIGCPDVEEEVRASVLAACANKIQIPSIEAPRPPNPPVLPNPIDLDDPPVWTECPMPYEAPRLVDGQCTRYVATCEAGPWPTGEPGDQYVDDDAPAGGNGTVGAPFRTVQEALGRPGAILLAEGDYQLPSITRVSQTLRGLCPERTRLVADVELLGASLEQLTIEGVVFVGTEATIEDVAVAGRVSTLARTQLRLHNSFVQTTDVSQPAFVSRGTSLLDSVAVRAPSGVGVDVRTGRVEATGLLVAHARPSVRVSSPAGANLEQSWLHAGQGRPAVVVSGLASVTGRDVYVEATRTGVSQDGSGSVVLRRTTIDADAPGLTSTATTGTSGLLGVGTVFLQDVRIRTRSEGGRGIEMAGNRLTAERLHIEGPAQYSIEARNTADISITDLVVNNPGYERLVPDAANPGQMITINIGEGIRWTSDQSVVSNLDLTRALFRGVPQLAFHAAHDAEADIPNNRTQRASAALEDITITRGDSDGRLSGGLGLVSVDAVVKRMKSDEPSLSGSMLASGRGLYHFEDIEIAGDLSPAIQTLQTKNTEGLRKELRVVMRRVYLRTRGPSFAASIQGSALDIEDVKVDATRTADFDEGGEPALRFSGPSEEPNPLGASINRVSVRSNHDRMMRVDDFHVSVPQLSNIILDYQGPSGAEGLHFEDSSFAVDGLLVTGRLKSAIGTSSDGSLANPGQIRLRNVFADGPEGFYSAVEDPCMEPPQTMCNLASKDADFFILLPGDQRRGLCD